MTVRFLKRIQALSPVLANQIAAGEVIERPASVLKELLENSIDANSSRIDIRIERGGMGLISVQDDGEGICKEDLALALLPHATSKITTLLDLENVGSFGFRGEALASINAVSGLTLSSYVSGQASGWRIEAQGREGVPSLKPAPLRQGSTVEIRDLFYNTPARRKFMRSEKTESLYLEEVFKRIALSQPAIAFQFDRGERAKKNLPACRTLQEHTRRVALLCGSNFVEGSHYIEGQANGLKLVGWLGSASVLRAQADLQYFYVNGRVVRDKVVMHAVRQAYQSVCEPGRYPAYVLYFQLDPASVDVNVHPTKHEVRFREARIVHAFLSYAIQEGLLHGKRQTAPQAVQAETLHTRLLQTVNVETGELETGEQNADLSQPAFANNTTAISHLDTSNKSAACSYPLLCNAGEDWCGDHGVVAAKPSVKLLSIANGELVFIEHVHGVYMVDVKKSRKMVIQRSLKESYQSLEGVSKRSLLMPQSIVVEAGAEAVLASPIDWSGLGFEITAAGDRVVLVRSVPTLFGSMVDNLPAFLSQLLTLHEIEQAIDFMSEYRLATDRWPDERVKAWWLEMESQRENDQELICFYKMLTVDQIRKIL